MIVKSVKNPGLDLKPFPMPGPRENRKRQVAAQRRHHRAQYMNRLFTLPPGVPADRVSAMRKAFDATFNDDEFLADVEKTRVVLRRTSVERIKEVALLWLDMPKNNKQELQQILKIQ